MLDRVKTYIAVVEERSINKAAIRLRITQPALSRQMKALEQIVGGCLLEREANGVKPTGLGHQMIKTMKPLVESCDDAVANLRKTARGERSEVRVGYLSSAADRFLTPAIAQLRKHHPEAVLKLSDMSPTEQIDALRTGNLDLALTGQEGALGVTEFHTVRLCTLGVCVAVADNDRLARLPNVSLRDLKGRDFVGVDEEQVPGRNRWATGLCRSAGFKPRFIVIVDGITNVLSQVVSESAVTLLPDYFLKYRHPGAVFVPISDQKARWEFIVLRQKGRASKSVMALAESLKSAAQNS